MNDKLVDRISALPNDILVYLLSFVEMKTAGRTSLLSRRWRYVWTLLTDLIFEDKEAILQHRKVSSLSTSEAKRFSKWVDQVMISHRAPYLNTLRIHFPMCGSFGANSIGKWVNFALKKNVNHLELNLANVLGRCMIDTENLYDICPTFHHHYYGTTLKSLHLEAIYIQGPAVENVLCNCVNVERLIMRSCHFFPNMIMNYCVTSPYTKLVVSSLKLKLLEFSHCSFESIQISAPQLTSFVLIAEHRAAVEYTNVPSLVDVTFKAAYCYHINHNLNVFSQFSYRLQKFSIYWSQVSYAVRGFPHLHKGNLLLVLTSLIEACPLLHTFKLEVDHSTLQHEAAKQEGVTVAVAGYSMRAHEHIRVVEFVGFDGSVSLVELAICLTQHSPLLKQIIFNPRCSQLMGGFTHIFCDRKNANGFDFARRQARLLVNQIRRDVDVVIL